MKYRIDNEYLEHSCCWDTAIIYDCKENKGRISENWIIFAKWMACQ